MSKRDGQPYFTVKTEVALKNDYARMMLFQPKKFDKQLEKKLAENKCTKLLLKTDQPSAYEVLNNTE